MNKYQALLKNRYFKEPTDVICYADQCETHHICPPTPEMVNTYNSMVYVEVKKND